MRTKARIQFYILLYMPGSVFPGSRVIFVVFFAVIRSLGSHSTLEIVISVSSQWNRVSVKFLIVVIGQQLSLDVVNGLSKTVHELVEVFLVKENLVFVITVTTESAFAFRDGNVVIA